MVRPHVRWPTQERPPLVLGGPTACGKSSLALALADAVDGELVCADSRQLYDGMRIVSAGPTDAERARAPHHLYGVVDPTESMSAGQWIARCDAAVDDVLARGKTPIVVGGSGLYLRAWRYGLQDVPPRDEALRQALEAECTRDGAPALHARLVTIDPDAAAAIAPTDPVRIVRAIEVHTLTGVRASERRTSHDVDKTPRRAARWLLLDCEMTVLTPRIAARAAEMLAGGLVDEARALRARLGPEHRLLATLGVQEALALDAGTLSSRVALETMTVRQRQYARRQRTWFRIEPWWARLPYGGGQLAAALAAIAAEAP